MVNPQKALEICHVLDWHKDAVELDKIEKRTKIDRGKIIDFLLLLERHELAEGRRNKWSLTKKGKVAYRNAVYGAGE
jgi:DNA-binding IclR family transcriptional regulator